MSINLKKGDSINLKKSVPSLTRVRIGMGWEKVSAPLDLDASVFACRHENGAPKLFSDQHFIFFNNLTTPNGSIHHTGDNRTGAGEGDDESVIVDLTKLESEITEISFIVTIYEAITRRQNFGMLKDAYIKVYDEVTNAVICEYDLDANFSNETACQLGSLIKVNGEWSFKAVGAGYVMELGDFLAGYQG